MGLGRAYIGIQIGPGYKDKAKWGRVGPVRVEWGRLGPSRAECGWGGVGHALGSNSIALRLGPGYKAEWGWGGVGHWGRFGSSGAE